MTSDPRGPIRKIVKIEESPTGGLTKVTHDCGHVNEFNQIYHYEVGADSRCFKCREL